MDTDRRAKLIRELDQAAREAARQGGIMRDKFSQLVTPEYDESGMTSDEVLAVDQALISASRALGHAGQVAAKYARLLDGPKPALLLRASREPGRLDIIAREPGGDTVVGGAKPDGDWWRIRLTALDGTRRGSISIGHGPVDDVQNAVNRYLDDHGPWWGKKEARHA